MTDIIKINGTAVRTNSAYLRTIDPETPGGYPLAEAELIIIVRGSMANRSMKQLLSTEPIRVDMPDRKVWISFLSTLHTVNVASSGAGESAAYRFDVVLRETPESAQIRSAEIRARQIEEAAAEREAEREAERKRQEQLAREEASAPKDLSDVQVSGNSQVWATALKQLKDPNGGRPAAPPEPPLTAVELSGIEAVLVNLRLDAIIDLLEASGRLKRSHVESRFMQLVEKRFVAEATPVVGEKAARRAAKDLLG